MYVIGYDWIYNVCASNQAPLERISYLFSKPSFVIQINMKKIQRPVNTMK